MSKDDEQDPSPPKPGEIVISNNCDTCGDHGKQKLESFKGPVEVDLTQPDVIVIRKRKDGKPGPKYDFLRKP